MRNLKKVLALVIAFSMMLSVVAFAGYNDVDADADYAGAVELLSALDIIKGDDQGNFNPDNTITRSEMAAIICRAKGLEDAANGAKGPTAFTDVAADHWASGYVNLASQNGIIAGYGNGLFGPEDTLTYEAAVAMIVRALGFEPMAAMKGGWSAGYVVVANTYKITEGADATATRANVAILMANAMDTPMMDQTTYGADAEYEVLDGKKDREYRTLLTDMDIYVATGIVGSKDADEVAFTVTEDSEDDSTNPMFEKGDDLQIEINGTDIAAYQYQQVDAYVLVDGRDYVAVAIVPSEIGETFTLLSDDVKAVINNKADDDTSAVKNSEEIKVEYYVDPANSSKTKEIKIDLWNESATDKIMIEYNKKAYDKTLTNLVAENDIELVFIENTGDTTYDMLVATKYTSDRVDYVDVERDKLSLKYGGTVTFDFDDEEDTIIFVDDQGNEIALEDLAEDDVVAYVADHDRITKYNKYVKVIKLANAAVTGTVDEAYTSNEDPYVVIDGKEYVDTTDSLGVGDEGTFYIGLTGKVIDFDGSLAGDNYAYIIEGAISTAAFTGDQWQIKLLTKEDGIVTYDITKNYHATVEKYITDNFTLNADKDAFLWADAKDKGADYRLVTIKTNANGEIKELVKADVDTKSMDKEKDFYRDDAQSIAGASLEEDIVIFNVSDDDADDVYTTDISFLVDESGYTGYAGLDADDEYSVMVITDLQNNFSEDTGFAVVTKVASGKDAAGEEITKITYVQDETEGTVSFKYGDETDCLNAKDIVLEMGDVFMFVADAEGLVSEYIVIATLELETKVVEEETVTIAGTEHLVLTEDVDTPEEAAKELGKDTTLQVGYILNTNRKTNNKGEIITIADPDTTVVVRGTSNKYTFNNTGRNNTIDVSDFMSDVNYKEMEIGEDGKETGNYWASPILVRCVDGIVIDAYTTSYAKKFTKK